jgi:ABC-type antimicrobial peptide transport system permease subunit
MPFLLFEHFQNAYHSLKSTRVRTFLTVLGVAIGVASVTTILSLSSGVAQVVSRQVDAIGGNIAVVRPGVNSKGGDLFSNPTIDRTYTASTLTEQDLEDIEKIENVEATAPLMMVPGSLKAKDTTVNDGTIIATTPPLEAIADLSVADGQFIDAVTNRDTAVIGNQLSIDLFGTDQSIGQRLSVRGQTFTVIGILKRTDNPINYNNVNFDRSVIISLESGKSFHQGVAEIQQINIRANSPEQLSSVISTVNDRLKQNHLGENDFTILSGKQVAEPSNRFFIALTGVMSVIAAISLVVGGIGIMNIMLVGVAERTREIGLRKAVGASHGNIVWQFLVEALIMSLMGGLLGYVAGYIIAFIASAFLTFTPAFTWQIALAAFVISVVIGTLFGIYPALRAARKNAIESLRRYH